MTFRILTDGDRFKIEGKEKGLIWDSWTPLQVDRYDNVAVKILDTWDSFNWKYFDSRIEAEKFVIEQFGKTSQFEKAWRTL